MTGIRASQRASLQLKRDASAIVDAVTATDVGKFPDTNIADALQINVRTVERAKEALKAKGILVRYWDLPRIADKLRITIGTPDQNDRLLSELKALL